MLANKVRGLFTTLSLCWVLVQQTMLCCTSQDIYMGIARAMVRLALAMSLPVAARLAAASILPVPALAIGPTSKCCACMLMQP